MNREHSHREEMQRHQSENQLEIYLQLSGIKIPGVAEKELSLHVEAFGLFSYYNEWKLIGRTEQIRGDASPQFMQNLVTDYYFQILRPIRFLLFHQSRVKSGKNRGNQVF
jgi:hypothetical protein